MELTKVYGIVISLIADRLFEGWKYSVIHVLNNSVMSIVLDMK